MREIKPFPACLIIILAALLSAQGCGSSSLRLDNPTSAISGNHIAPVRSSVTLSGAGSNDKKNLPLTYAWTLADKPIGSAAALSGSTGTTTSFYADKGGYYNVQLVVTNSNALASSPSSFIVDARGVGANHPPVAVMNVTTGSGVAMLDGSGSYDIDGNPITYAWSVTDPDYCSIVDANKPVAQLYAISGVTCVVSLIVSDGADSDESFAQAAIQ